MVRPESCVLWTGDSAISRSRKRPTMSACTVPTSTRFASCSPSPVPQRDCIGRARELEHVDGVLVDCERGHRHVGKELAHRQNHVRVLGVAEVREEELRVSRAHGRIALDAVDLAGDDADAVRVQLGRAGRVRLEHAVRDAEVLEALDQPARDRVPMGDDHRGR